MITTDPDIRSSAPGLMDRLKAETSEHHARAEGKTLQRALLKGTIGRDAYAAYLGQLLLVHTELEDAIDRARAADARLDVITPAQRHSERLVADLVSLGSVPASVTALGATEALLGEIRAASPAGLLGMHYVLEGSMNGNRYIAMAVRRSLQLTPGQGDRYLDPYGEQQRPNWQAFRASVDAHTWEAAAADEAVRAAQVMFDGVGAISEDVAAKFGM